MVYAHSFLVRIKIWTTRVFFRHTCTPFIKIIVRYIYSTKKSLIYENIEFSFTELEPCTFPQDNWLDLWGGWEEKVLIILYNDWLLITRFDYQMRKKIN